MSDPVSNAEVEDVLSSIRRLVSEDKRPLQKRTGTTGPDRLVLTPALRVEETEESNARPEAAALPDRERVPHASLRRAEAEKDRAAGQAAPPPEDDYSADPYGFDQTDDEADDADLEDLVAASLSVAPDASAPEPAEEPSVAEIDRETLARLLDDEGSEDHRQSVEDPSADGSEEETFDLGGDTQILEDEENDDWSALSDEAEVGPSEEVSEPSEGARFVPEEAESQTESGDEATAEPYFTHRSLEEEAAEGAAEEGQSDEDQSGRTEALSEKIAQLETAIGNIRDTWEPDGRSGDDYAGTEPPAMAWEDDLPEESGSQGRPHRADYSGVPDKEDETASDADADPAPMGATVSDFSKVTGAFASHSEARGTEALSESTESETGLDLGGDEQIIDEAVLRDLVSEIVREELQGALGERITRNVRKLVRREIHRALTAQDLS